MGTLWQDLKYAARMLAKNYGFTSIAVLALALGIGANTAIFSLVNAALLKSLPVADPGSLMYVFAGTSQEPYSVASYPDYVDLRDQNKAFSGLAAYSGVTLTMRTGGEPELLRGSIVSGNYFDLLGVRATEGRTFLPEEDQTPNTHPVAIISHGLWQRRFGGSRETVGSTLVLNGQPFTVVGVMSKDFNGAETGARNEIWVPMMMQSLVRPPRGGYSGERDPDLLKRRSAGWLTLIGRLQPGVTAEQAQAALNTLGRGLAESYPETNRDRVFAATPASKGDPEMRGTLVSVAGLLLGTVALVLLIACANVANLLLARSAARRKEISIRLALGASRARLVKQLMTESVLLAIVGGAFGLLLAWWAIDALTTYVLPANLLPVNVDVRLDLTVLGFTLLLSLLTGLVFGLAPALQASKHNLVTALKDDSLASATGERRFNLRGLLVVTQIALSLVLLISAGLFVRSLRQAQTVNPGFDPDNVLVASLNINLLRYTKAQGTEFYRQVTERVETLPGVRSVALARIVPLSGSSRTSSFVIEGQSSQGGNTSETTQDATGNVPAAQEKEVSVNVVGGNYFQTMSIPLAQGRAFNPQDRDGAPGVAIVNESFARKHFPGQAAIGQRVRIGNSRNPFLEIVGITKDGKYNSVGEEPKPFLYLPLLQNHETGMTLHARTEGDPTNLFAAVRREVQGVEPNLPLFDIRLMTDQVSTSLAPARYGATLLGVFSGLALLLAAVGIYGVMAYSVSRRTREIGIRISLGAQTSDVLKLIIKEGLKLILIGVAVGLLGAFAVTRLLTGFLYGIEATDPLTFIVVTMLLGATALIACYIPARRAMKVDPMVALRYE